MHDIIRSKYWVHEEIMIIQLSSNRNNYINTADKNIRLDIIKKLNKIIKNYNVNINLT